MAKKRIITTAFSAVSSLISAFFALGFWGSRINKLAFWRERRAGRCKAPRRRRCDDIVEERQRSRCPPAAAPRRAAAPKLGEPEQLASYDSIGHRSRSKMPNHSCASPKLLILAAVMLLQVIRGQVFPHCLNRRIIIRQFTRGYDTSVMKS